MAKKKKQEEAPDPGPPQQYHFLRDCFTDGRPYAAGDLVLPHKPENRQAFVVMTGTDKHGTPEFEDFLDRAEADAFAAATGNSVETVRTHDVLLARGIIGT